MLNHKKNESGIAGNSYLISSRLFLSKLFSKDNYEKEIGWLLLTLTFNCYFNEGTIRYNRRLFVCRRGEWITSFLHISRLTGIHRYQVSSYMDDLVKLKYISIEKISGGGCRIRFDAYLKFLESIEKQKGNTLAGTPATPPPPSKEQDLNFPSKDNLILADGSYV